MGMVGNYVSVDETCLQKIMNNTENILSLNSELYKTLDIDKAWAGLRYLFCGRKYDAPPPMSYIVPMLQDHAITSISDFPVFYITPAQVCAAAQYLASLTDATVRDMYHFDAMRKDELYPITAQDTSDAFYDYLQHHLKKLKAFYRNAAEKNYAIVFVII